MNQELFTKFAEIVKAGKVPGVRMEYGLPNDMIIYPGVGTVALFQPDIKEWVITPRDTAILCHHIREWLTGQGWEWELTGRSLTIAKETLCIHKPNAPRFSEGSQLDWHIQAVVDICAGKEATL